MQSKHFAVWRITRAKNPPAFSPDAAVFTLDSSNTVLQYNGIDGEQYGDSVVSWPETATFSTVDVGDFFDIVPITPPL